MRRLVRTCATPILNVSLNSERGCTIKSSARFNVRPYYFNALRKAVGGAGKISTVHITARMRSEARGRELADEAQRKMLGRSDED